MADSKFASRVFILAGVYGLLVLPPFYFLEERIGRDTPPPITHPEYYYGFLGVTIAWQIAFVMIGRNPVRYRPLMLVAVFEKVSYGVVALPMYVLGRIGGGPLMGGIIDLGLAVLFILAFQRTSSPASP